MGEKLAGLWAGLGRILSARTIAVWEMQGGTTSISARKANMVIASAPNV